MFSRRRRPLCECDLSQLEKPICFASDWLCAYLFNGPRPAGEILAAAQGRGISPRTLRRAKKICATFSYKRSNDHPWYWVCTAWYARTHPRPDNQHSQDVQNERAQK